MRSSSSAIWRPVLASDWLKPAYIDVCAIRIGFNSKSFYYVILGWFFQPFNIVVCIRPISKFIFLICISANIQWILGTYEWKRNQNFHHHCDTSGILSQGCLKLWDVSFKYKEYARWYLCLNNMVSPSNPQVLNSLVCGLL